jgi:DNA-binding transcriptional ArsR family regulator
MVNYQPNPLDTTFAALSDPTRRAILAQLAERNGLSVSDIARPFKMSLPAVLKHLEVLTDAKLIRRTKSGRVVSCELTAAPLEDAMRWLNRYAQFWSQQLDRLAAFVEQASFAEKESFVEKESWPSPSPTPGPTPPSSPASPSSVVSMRRRKKSTPPGPTPKKS